MCVRGCVCACVLDKVLIGCACVCVDRVCRCGGGVTDAMHVALDASHSYGKIVVDHCLYVLQRKGIS